MIALLALTLVLLLFELPQAVRASRFELGALRLSVDGVALVSAWALSFRLRFGRAVRRVLGVVAGVLVLYRLDVALCRVLMRQSPMLYDQLFLLRHLGVLIADLWSFTTFGVVAGSVLLVVGLVWGTRALLGVVERELVREYPTLVLRCALAAPVCLLVLLWLQPSAAGVQRARRWTSCVSAELATGIADSLRIKHAIARGLSQSPYRAYDALTLTRKPSMLWLFVESYGRVMVSDPLLHDDHRRMLARMEGELTAEGWFFASAYSTAPISGGRSWLAHASAFTGVHVPYQALFQRLMEEGDRLPSWPRFLRRQGYNTVLLAPSDRERPGVASANYYHFQRIYDFDKVGYHGPWFGWGRVPDQFSLRFLQDRVLDSRSPQLVVFPMVSSHAPWKQVPEHVEDARDLSAYQVLADRPVEARASDAQVVGKGRGTVVEQLAVFTRSSKVHAQGLTDDALRSAYGRSVIYDLDLIRRALKNPKFADRVVLVMGDHQPPLITSEEQDFDVPIHVFSRDPALLAELLEHGFVPRLQLAPAARAALPHEALFSLLVRSFVRAAGQGQALPPLQPQGVALQ